MVQLVDSDIQTREVLDWQGIHLFHFWGSSCSQKSRIFLNLKQAQWHSHEINLPNNENFEPWYLGINPRGLVPALVTDGEVHIESNDIITVLDDRLPGDKLIPGTVRDELAALLRHEDDLHLALRTLTFRFTHARGPTPKSAEALQKYQQGGSGTVCGENDTGRPREIAFWQSAARDGITDGQVRTCVARFRSALDALDDTLRTDDYLLGGQLTVLDIAWFIYVNRLDRCTYPVQRLHPNVNDWFVRLQAMPQFASEVTVTAQIQAATDENHRRQAAAGQTLTEIARL